MIVNIILALLGLGVTLSAFGGKTWIDNDGPFKKRITIRGYILLACLFLAFFIGVLKEKEKNEDVSAKNSEIRNLKRSVDDLKIKLNTYKVILSEIADESERQDQRVFNDYVIVKSFWPAPNKIFPGAIIRLYPTKSGGNLRIRYGNDSSGYRDEGLDMSFVKGGTYYEFPIIGKSGESFRWDLFGSWEGKIYVYSSPRQRSNQPSWMEEAIK